MKNNEELETRNPHRKRNQTLLSKNIQLRIQRRHMANYTRRAFHNPQHTFNIYKRSPHIPIFPYLLYMNNNISQPPISNQNTTLPSFNSNTILNSQQTMHPAKPLLVCLSTSFVGATPAPEYYPPALCLKEGGTPYCCSGNTPQTCEDHVTLLFHLI